MKYKNWYESLSLRHDILIHHSQQTSRSRVYLSSKNSSTHIANMRFSSAIVAVSAVLFSSAIAAPVAQTSSPGSNGGVLGSILGSTLGSITGKIDTLLIFLFNLVTDPNLQATRTTATATPLVTATLPAMATPPATATALATTTATATAPVTATLSISATCPT